MFGLSMANLARRHPKKMDKALRNAMFDLYQPMRWVPCFLHSALESLLKRTKKYAVIIEFQDERRIHRSVKRADSCYKHFLSRIKHHYHVRSCSAILTLPL